jgi:hypothetical protein
MKIRPVITVNAIIFIAIGIGFTLYAPNVLAYFGVSDLPGDNTLLYWNVAAFSRMFGAMLFIFGMLLWAVRGFFQPNPDIKTVQREIIFSLIFGYIIITLAAVIQQSSVWGSLAGWVVTGFFAIFLALYIYFLVAKDK